MLKRVKRLFFPFALLVLPLILSNQFAFAGTPQSSTGLLITNDDNTGLVKNSATLFSIGSDGTLGSPTTLVLGGHGTGGGFFAANRVVVDPNTSCAYFSLGVSNTITGVQILTQTVTGTFSPSAADNGADNGVGMVMNENYLYASFSTSATIAVFAVDAGCQLQFLTDVFPAGLNGGTVKGMALFGHLLVVTYGDGSIESFNVAGGVPTSNGDAQDSAGFATDDFPDGVVITPDGHYAIFGDDSSDAAVEVSDISSGHLAAAIIYNLPSGFNSNNVLLSPDATLVYVVNNTSGQVSAAFFDKTTGVVSGSCISAQLSGFDSTFSFLSTPVTQLSTGTGSVIYLAEFGGPSAIAVMNVSVSGGSCTLTEAATSPVTDNNSRNLLSIAVLPIAQPGLYSPTPGSTLTGSNATFQWNGDPTATANWIDIGSTAGGNNYYSSGRLSTTTFSATVGGLPTNGSTVYVTLYFLINGSWVPNAYTFNAFNASGGTALLTTPAPGSVLSGTTVTFQWTAGSSATAYWLDIGTAAGGNNIYSSGNLGTALSTTVTTLPANGSALFATLYSLINGTWTPNTYAYTAFNAAAASGVLTTPTPGSTLNSGTVTFNWTAGSGASAYWMDIGSAPGGNNLHSSGNLGTMLTTTVSGLPTDGSTIYVTLYSLISGAWAGNTYTYTALNATGTLAAMQTPLPGTTLSGTSATFTWSSDSSATAYWVDIGSVPGGNNVYTSGNLGTALSTTVFTLPANASTIYVSLYSFVGGQWLINPVTYTSGP